MTFANVLKEKEQMLKPTTVRSDIDRQYHGYGHYPQNPYTNDMFMENMYYPQYNL